MSVEAVGALAEPVRRAVYEYAVGHGEPVSRNEVAEAVGIGRTLAAFHLDKLAEAGLLDISYARRSGRTGPGAGRPAKLYRRSAAEHAVSLPPRDYRTIAHVFAAAADRAGLDAAVGDAAYRRGVELARARPERDPLGLLAALGYEPAIEPAIDGGALRLRNCPFHALAEAYPPLVCGANLALLRGVLDGAGLAGHAARLDPGPEGCCVVIEAGSKNNND
jgi:predicted ArsR family transcriptional regulator